MENAADRFNKRVWTSQELIEAKAQIGKAFQELLEGEGWGLIALDEAEVFLKNALALIAIMKTWHEAPTK